MSAVPKKDEQAERLRQDVDLRLAGVYGECAFEAITGFWSTEFVMALLRAAYGKGYVDAHKEPRGKLMRDNGYRIPEQDESVG